MAKRGRPTVEIVLTGPERRQLESWARRHSSAQSLAMRCKIILACADSELSRHASRSKLAPFVRLARTIGRYRASIEATIEWRLTNGIAESNNASIGRLRANARGFHKPEAFITMTLLDRAGIAPDLPWTAAS
jgi:hypothetical protein